MESLRPLTDDEAALVARHPLPAGVSDGLVNKADLGLAVGKSDNTVSQWIKRGLPCEQEGTNGRPYLFRLSLAWAWMEDRRAIEARQRARSQEIAGQMALVLSGGTVSAEYGDADAQKRILELTILRNRVDREQGALMDRCDVVDTFERAFASIRDSLDALPDRLGRELNLDGPALEVIERACDDALTFAADRLDEMRAEAPADE